jgi:hypothetical protein
MRHASGYLIYSLSTGLVMTGTIICSLSTGLVMTGTVTCSLFTGLVMTGTIIYRLSTHLVCIQDGSTRQDHFRAAHSRCAAVGPSGREEDFQQLHERHDRRRYSL